MNPSDQSDLSDTLKTAPPEAAANTLLCLINQANYLLHRQLQRLEQDFLQHGGFTERLYGARSRQRQQSDRSDSSDTTAPSVASPCAAAPPARAPAPASRFGAAPPTPTAVAPAPSPRPTSPTRPTMPKPPKRVSPKRQHFAFELVERVAHWRIPNCANIEF